MYTLNNKQVYFLRPYIDVAELQKSIWRETSPYYILCNRSESGTIILADLDIFTAKLYANSSSEIKENAVFYFGSTSKFPRFKLSGTNYSRCIKREKADHICIGEIDYHEQSNCILCEDDKYYYIITKNIDQHYTRDKDSIEIFNSFKRDPIDFIIKNNLSIGNNFHFVTDKNIIVTTQASGKDMLSILNGDFVNIVTDKMVDEKVSGCLDSLSDDDWYSIIDLIESKDTSNKALGLKLLGSSNVSDIRASVKTLIELHPELTRVPEWTSVSIKQLRKSLGICGYIDVDYMYSYNPEFASERDLAFSRGLLKDRVLNRMHEILERFNWLEKIKLQYNLTIDEI